MSDARSDETTQETAQEKRPVGRPKGHPRSGGRPKGSRNRLPEELRRYVDHRGRPLDFLAAIAAGRKVTAADPENPDRKMRVYPSLPDRIAAARALLRKLLPDLKATELSGPGGGPLQVEDAPAMSKLEVARRIAFLLTEPLADEGARVLTVVAHNTEKSEPSVSAPDPIPSKEPEPGPVVGKA